MRAEIVLRQSLSQVKWAPFHQRPARPHVADGKENLQKLGVAANILNKKSRRFQKWL
jgi:hypothetical protein